MATTLPEPFDSLFIAAYDTAPQPGPFDVTTANIANTYPYQIDTAGSTDFTLIGAANNVVGTQFVAANAQLAAGTGTVLALQFVRSTATDAYTGDIGSWDIDFIDDGFGNRSPATDAFNGTSGSYDYSNIVITPTTLVDATKGLPYTQELTIGGGYAPYGNLFISSGLGNVTAANLTLSATTQNLTANTASATLAGTPTAVGDVIFVVTGNDEISGSTFTSDQAYTLSVVAPTITISPSSLANTTVGNTYSQTFTASGGAAPYTYSNVGSLPPSLTLDATGNLTGTITANATPASITVRATDSYSSTGDVTYTLNIAQPTITVVPSTLGNGSVGTTYTATISATGGYTPYTFLVTSGTLPANIALNSITGNITGTPTANGTSTFAITAYDSYGSPGSQSYTVGVVSPTITIAPATVANGVVGVGYTEVITATGGVAPYSWTQNNPLPYGLNLIGNTAVGNTGTVSLTGIPTASGVYNFGIVAIDSYGTEGVGNTYVVDMALPTITVSPSLLSNATTGAAYTANITASGGTGNYVFSVTGGTLPPNLTLANTTGVLSGIPLANSTANFTITAYDSYNSPGSRSYSLTTVDPAVLISHTPANLSGVVGVAYTQTFSSTGGTGPYTYSVTSGNLPANVSLSTLGNLTGTPTANGNSTFTITSTDSFASQGSFTYANVNIALPTIIVDPPSLPSVVVGNSYDQRITAFGGTDPYTFAVTSGNLPAGLSLSNVGNITGTTSVTGTANFTITATDSYDSIGSRPYSIVVETPHIIITPTSIANGIANVAYTQTFTATGGTEPYTFTSRNLPIGLTLDSNTGVLSGAPTVIGYQPFQITATDNLGYPGTQEYNFVVVPDVPPSAIEVYVGGIRQTSGYTVTSKTPATITFIDPPPANVAVTIAVRQGVSWYEPGLYSANDGVPLQETNTPAARFLRGVN